MYTLYITTSRMYRYMITRNNTTFGWAGNDLTKVTVNDLRIGADSWKTWITHHGDIVQEYPLKTIEDISTTYPELFI